MNDKYEKQMKKGVLDMLVLKLLRSEAKYGYQIIQEMKEKSDEAFLLKDGTLYPVLYRLEEQGYIEVARTETVDGRARSYYGVTEAGRAYLAETLEDYQMISEVFGNLMKGGMEHDL